jgi:hypothetical protein
MQQTRPATVRGQKSLHLTWRFTRPSQRAGVPPFFAALVAVIAQRGGFRANASGGSLHTPLIQSRRSCWPASRAVAFSASAPTSCTGQSASLTSCAQTARRGRDGVVVDTASRQLDAAVASDSCPVTRRHDTDSRLRCSRQCSSTRQRPAPWRCRQGGTAASPRETGERPEPSDR